MTHEHMCFFVFAHKQKQNVSVVACPFDLVTFSFLFFLGMVAQAITKAYGLGLPRIICVEFLFTVRAAFKNGLSSASWSGNGVSGNLFSNETFFYEELRELRAFPKHFISSSSKSSK